MKVEFPSHVAAPAEAQVWKDGSPLRSPSLVVGLEVRDVALRAVFPDCAVGMLSFL